MVQPVLQPEQILQLISGHDKFQGRKVKRVPAPCPRDGSQLGSIIGVQSTKNYKSCKRACTAILAVSISRISNHDFVRSCRRKLGVPAKSRRICSERIPSISYSTGLAVNNLHLPHDFMHLSYDAGTCGSGHWVMPLTSPTTSPSIFGTSGMNASIASRPLNQSDDEVHRRCTRPDFLI